MPASVQQVPYGATWPMGLVTVATPGTTVRLTSLVDANNTNAPETASNTTTAEYTPLVSQFTLGGFKPGVGNNGLQPNQGNVYLLRWNANTGGGGNRSDPGVLLTVIPAGQTITWPPAPSDSFSPYGFGFDADNANDAVLTTGIRGQ